MVCLSRRWDVEIERNFVEEFWRRAGFQDMLEERKMFAAFGKEVSVLDGCTGMADGSEAGRDEGESRVKVEWAVSLPVTM